jgi:hypothetical protein
MATLKTNSLLFGAVLDITPQIEAQGVLSGTTHLHVYLILNSMYKSVLHILLKLYRTLVQKMQ